MKDQAVANAGNIMRQNPGFPINHFGAPGDFDTTTTNNKIAGFPLYDGATLLDFTGAQQVFAFSGAFTSIWLSPTLAPVMTSEGVTVNSGDTFTYLPQFDVLFVLGGIGQGVAPAL